MQGPISHIRAYRTRIALLSLVAVGACDLPTTRADRGRQLFEYCVQCHGSEGQGNPQYKTPSIAGLDAWYVEAELQKFRTGARGEHPRDVNGLRMRPMSRVLANDDEIRMVATYVSMLPPAPSEAMVVGDAARGRALFQPCVQCHGSDARGKRDMNAPNLHPTNDWYLSSQLRNFRSGIRGTSRLDTTGAQMRPMALALADDKAVDDVVAYIRSMQ